jgi:hypothetical protein
MGMKTKGAVIAIVNSFSFMRFYIDIQAIDYNRRSGGWSMAIEGN